MSSNVKKQQKKKPKQKPRANPRPRFRNNRGDAPGVHMSKCALGYASSIQDPFNVHGFGVPVAPNPPTLKTWAFARGGFSTQTSNNQGFIFFNPRGLVVSDSPAVWHTTAATTAATMTRTGTTAVTGNSQFTLSQIGSSDVGIRFRIVSAGLRIKYNGTELQKGGAVWSALHPSHNDLEPFSYTQFSGLNVAAENRPSKDWITVLWCPALVNDYEFLGSIATNPAPMGHYIQAPTGAPQTFEYEAFCNFEVNGFPVRGMTASMIDPVGAGAVANAMGSSPQQAVSTNSSAHKSTFFKTLEDSMLSGLSWVGSAAGTAITSGLASATGQLLYNTTGQYLKMQAAALLEEAGPALLLL